MEWPDVIGAELGDDEWPEVLDLGLAKSKPEVDRAPLKLPAAWLVEYFIFGSFQVLWRTLVAVEMPPAVRWTAQLCAERLAALAIWSGKVRLANDASWPQAPPERQLKA